MSAIAVRVVETGEVFPSIRAAVKTVTGRPVNGNDWTLVQLGRPIAGVHLAPVNDPYWEPDCGWRRRQRPVRCVQAGTVYPSLSAAARSIGVFPYTLCRAIRRERPCGGALWVYEG